MQFPDSSPMKTIKYLVPVVALLAFLFISSCRKNSKEESPSVITEDIAMKIKKLGFDTTGLRAFRGGYLVEGDIFLSKENVDHGFSQSPALTIAKTEQYRTTNLVTGLPRVITITAQNFNTTHINALDQAINKYNQVRLRLTFSRVASGGQITIVGYYDPNDPKLGFSGLGTDNSAFPSGGNPSSQININTFWTGSLTAETIAAIIQHEMGHTIGFRHTDWQDRSYSCGGNSVNEGLSTVGAVQIPGTPSGADQESWMLSCLNPGQVRTFNPNDIIALAYLYGTNSQPGSQQIWEYYNATNTDNVVTTNGNYQNYYPGWAYVGSSFRAFYNNSTTGTVPVYEYYNSINFDHAYSKTDNDPNIIGFPGWAKVGLAFYVYSSNIAGSIPVYWYYNSSQTRHLYTSNPNIASQFPGWSAPQVAWYAAQ